MEDKPRIVIGEDDLVDVPSDGTAASARPTSDQTNTQVPATPSAPPALPPVGNTLPRQVGVAKPNLDGSAGRFLNDPRSSILIAAAVGIFLGWAVTEIFNVQSLFDKALINATSESDFKQRLNVAAGVWVGIVGLIFGLSYLTFDRAVSGAWEEVGRRAVRAAVPLAVVSFISGYLAQWIYYEMASSATSVSTAYVARMIGWAIFGGGVGLAIGLVDKSKQRAINGALGGLAGGAIGGVVFEFVLRKEIFGESLGRLVALLAVGLAIAFAVRLVETARREAWLSIVAGGMSGKEFIIYHELTRIGASPDCEIFLLKDPAVDKYHATILDRDGHRTLAAVGPVSINQEPVREKILRSGDQIQIGSTVISYAERDLAPAGMSRR